MKRYALVFVVVLLGLSSSAFAVEGLSLTNQTGLAITATLTQTSALSEPMKANETYVFGPFPNSQYTLRITSGNNITVSKTFGVEMRYASFHRAGQVYVITVSATPIPPPPTPTKK